MDINRIKSIIQDPYLRELNSIEPGEVRYFPSTDGLDQWEINTLSDLLRYFRRLRKDNNIKLNIVPTEDERLIGAFAGRSLEEIRAPFKVIVSTWDTVAGFASQYFGEDVQAIVDRVPKEPTVSRLRISATNLPAIVEIDPDNRPAKVQRKSVEQRIESSY